MSDLNKSIIFDYFEEISKIPRCSGNRKAIVKYLEDFANENDLDYKKDGFDNVIIKKTASNSDSNRPIALQAHSDMVCEKTEDSNHDFDRDPISLLIDKDYMRANNTTLGADNGLGLAMILAILADNKAIHPPIEAIITSDEEIGLIGANGLDIKKISADRLINLDFETENKICISCAGGTTLNMNIPIKFVSANNLLEAKIMVSGLKGGHSGLDIHKKRLNAIKVLRDILNLLKEDVNIGIVNISGGDKHNTIPIEAYASIAYAHEDKLKIERYIVKIKEELKDLYKKDGYEEELIIELLKEKLSEDSKILHHDSFNTLMAALTLMPHGPYAYSSIDKRLVDTSSNFARISIDDNINIISSLRFSSEKNLNNLKGKMLGLIGMLNGVYEFSDGYPAWPIKEKSELINIFSVSHKKEFGTSPDLEIIHAGLETAIFAAKNPEMDMISIGPNLFDVHTVKEKLDIESANRVFLWLKNTLAILD